MTPREEHRLPDDLHAVAERLRQEKAEATPLELDRMKLTVMSRAARSRGAPTRRRTWRARVASPVLAGALLLGGVAALAGNTSGPPVSVGGSNASSANSEYCPASSPGAGKPKNGKNKCGQAP